MSVVTRFAPSPTGFLHIGGARTALFNWLYARRHHGKFLLRIEDTDRARSTQAATDAILDGMKWLGLDWDGEPVSQFERTTRHAEVAKQLLDNGHAYHCYCSSEELQAMREAGQVYDRRWRDSTNTPPAGVKPALRLKAPLDGEVIVKDHVRGEVHVPAGQLEDLVILRSDGSPTYNLAVVVDDHDMGVTHIIRGEDHLTNAAKQMVIYQVMGWPVPEFAHVPLIHGPDGAKLSKRHGAQAVGDYREMGYLPEALRNYLLRLGWSHGDDEIISTEQATQWFNLEGIGKSASRFDFVKLENLNGHYIREADDKRLAELIGAQGNAQIIKGMAGLKQRAKTIKELAESAKVYLKTTQDVTTDAQKLLGEFFTGKPAAKPVFEKLAQQLSAHHDWERTSIETQTKSIATDNGLKMGDLAQPLRFAVTGSKVSPPIFEVMEIIGRDESLARLKAAA